MESAPLYYDLSPLPGPVDAVAHLLGEIGAMTFDQGTPQGEALASQALLTYRRLAALRGRVQVTTDDRMLLYVLGRAVDDGGFARELAAALDQVLAAHGQPPARASAGARSIAELAAEPEPDGEPPHAPPAARPKPAGRPKPATKSE